MGKTFNCEIVRSPMVRSLTRGLTDCNWSGSGPVLWTPINMANLLAWFDSSDSSTITDSAGAVSEWRDKSGNGKHATQATGSLQPTTGVSTLAGKNVIVGDNVDDILEFPASTDLTEDIHVLCVAKNIQQYDCIFDFRNSSDPADRVLHANGALVRQKDGSTDVLLTNYPVGQHILYAAHINSQVATNNEWQFIVDGSTTQVSGYPKHTASPALTAGDIGDTGYLFDDSTGGNAWGGGMGEYVAINGSLSIEDRQKTEGYFAWKWGMEGKLPPSHPYKSGAPTV